MIAAYSLVSLLLWMGSQQQHYLSADESVRLQIAEQVSRPGNLAMSASTLDLRNHYQDITILPGALDAAIEPPNPTKGAIVCWEDTDQFIRCKDSQGKNRTRPIDDKWFDDVDGGPIVLINVRAKPEPIDVPAIGQKVDICPAGKWCVWDEWTCADKSRILLTDESGGKHCIKFPKEQP